MLNQALLMLIFLGLASCANWSKETCDQADWFHFGREDASRGTPHHPRGRFATLNVCKKNGDPELYVKRYNEGVEHELRLICNYEGGRRFGAKGLTAPLGMCKKWDEAGFSRGHKEGLREYNLQLRESAVSAREQKVRGREAELNLPVGSAVKQCTFDSDCGARNSCLFNKCEFNGEACTFDSECRPQIRCSLGKCEKSF